MEHLPFKTQKALVAPLCVWEAVEDPLALGLSFEASTDLIADSWVQMRAGRPASVLAQKALPSVRSDCPEMRLS